MDPPIRRLPRYYDGTRYRPRALDPILADWALVVGNRIRRMRAARGWTLLDLSREAPRADGSHYSLSYLSRIERGWASAPLFVYLTIASGFEIDPGRLLGTDAAMLDASEPELTLLRTLREMAIAPHEVLAQLIQARSTAMRNSSPSMRVESPPPS
jgi:transcriptional regulator with XRE-family HTH domain